jgi:hypothetical protein
MTSERPYFIVILAVAFSALFAAALANNSLRPTIRPWQLLVYNGPHGPPGWSRAMLGHSAPARPNLARKVNQHRA